MTEKAFHLKINKQVGWGREISRDKITNSEYQPNDMPKIVEALKREEISILHIIRDFHESLVSILQAKKSGNWLYLGVKGVTVPNGYRRSPTCKCK